MSESTKPIRRVRAPRELRNSPDRRANKEAEAIGAGTLEEEASKSQHGRRESVRDHVKRAIIIVIWVGVIIYLISLVIWSLHLLTPEICPINFLVENQLNKIETIIFSTIALTVAGFVGKNYM